MRRRDLDAAAAQLGLGPLVRHQRDLAIGQRQEEFSAGQGHIAKLFQLRQQRLAALANGVDLLLDVLPFFGRRFGQLVQQPRLGAVQGRLRIGVHGHGRIAQHGLRPRGGDRHVRRFARLRVDHRVLEVPEVALHFLVEYLVVADRRLQERVPVDQPLAAIDQALAVQVEERAADRAAQTSSSVNRVRRQSQLQPICFSWPRMRLSYWTFHSQIRSTSFSRPRS